MNLELNTIWFILVGVLFTGYAMLDGFDLGLGALHRRRRVVCCVPERLCDDLFRILSRAGPAARVADFSRGGH
jgi:hypothetical protein